MATYTNNYALVKPTYGELADVAVINGNMDTIDGIMHSNRTMLAPAFSQTEDYAEGDVVVYEGNLYRFIVPHTAGNWDGTEVEQTTLGEELSTKGGADVTKTASGNPITFSDGASAPLVKCVTQITGSQDLHGYDKPWVGGAGKNKYNAQKITETADGITITKNEFGEYTVTGTATALHQFALGTNTIKAGDYILNGCPSGGSSSTYDIRFTNNAIDNGSGATLHLDSDTSDSIYITVRNGYSFPSGGLVFKPMIRLSTETDPTFAPYSNICPITAYDEVEIEVRGRNEYVTTNTTAQSNSAAVDIINATSIRVYRRAGGTYPASKQLLSNYNFIEGKTYKVKAYANVVSGIAEIAIRDTSNNPISASSQISTSGNLEMNFTYDPNTMDYLSFFATYNQTTGGDITYERIAIYDIDVAPTTHTSTFPDAIYRGSEDVVNGKVSADDDEEMWVTVDISTLNFSPSTGSRHIFRSDSLRGIIKPSETFISMPYAITSCYCGMGYGPISENDNGYFAVAQATNEYEGRFVIVDHRFSTVDDFVAGIAGQTIAYRLNTPTTSSVTPTNLPIRTLSGYTHIESTTGDMEVEYITSEYQPLVDLIEGSGGSGHTYSTTEQVVGKWIDGKDVYEKTYDIGYLTSNNKTIAHGISGFGHIIQVHGYVTNGTYDFHLPHVTTDAVSCVGVHVDSTNIYITSYDRSDYHGYVIMQYTKSTHTRSLNLTKSAVSDSKEELSDELKNAEYEEKPDVNEADDDAPTEVDER